VRDAKGTVLLSWSSVHSLYSKVGSESKEVSGVRYKLIFSKEKGAAMDSVCAIKASGGTFTVYEDVDGDNKYAAQLPLGEEIHFNVIAVID
jgi:uncharacterized membrane protein